jgi:hypothetical protein
LFIPRNGFFTGADYSADIEISAGVILRGEVSGGKRLAASFAAAVQFSGQLQARKRKLQWPMLGSIEAKRKCQEVLEKG